MKVNDICDYDRENAEIEKEIFRKFGPFFYFTEENRNDKNILDGIFLINLPRGIQRKINKKRKTKRFLYGGKIIFRLSEFGREKYKRFLLFSYVNSNIMIFK